MSQDEFEEVSQLLELTANTLRGMTLDPAVPEHAKGAMRLLIEELEATAAGLVS